MSSVNLSLYDALRKWALHKRGPAIEDAGDRRRSLLRKAQAAALGLLISAAIEVVITSFNHVSSLSSAYAAGRGVHGASGNGVGNGNGGVPQNDAGPPSTSSPFSDSQPGQQGQIKLDSDDPVDRWLANEKIDLGLPGAKQIEADPKNDALSDYLGTIDYPGKISTPQQYGSPKTGDQATGKAVVQRSKVKVEDTRARSDNASGRSPNLIAIDPRSYSRREVLAIDLAPATISSLNALGYTAAASERSGEGAITALTIPADMDAMEAIDLLAKEIPGKHFQLNHLYHLYHTAMKKEAGLARRIQPASVNGANCLDERCYAQTAIRWKEKFAACAQGMRVGVIDTDIDFHHPTFAGQKITRRSFLPQGRLASADAHGTGVLALLAGGPNSGTPGLINEASFFVASIFFIDDDGEPVTDTMSLVKALDWMSISRVTLINMSFSGPVDDLVHARISDLSAQGFVFAAAAGNEGPGAGPSYPAAYPEVIAITAVTQDLRIYPFANRGAFIDLAAPGVDIWTAFPDAREGYRSGTSFAAPFATAVLAIQHGYISHRPKDELLNHIRTLELGRQGRNPTYGRGLVQAPEKCPDPLPRSSSIAD